MLRNTMISLVILATMVSAVSAGVRTYSLESLEGDYAAVVGASTRAVAVDVSDEAGVVTDVSIHLVGDYRHGVLEDDSGETAAWTADLVVFLKSGDRDTWAVARPVPGGFDLNLPFVDLAGSPAASRGFPTEDPVTVSAALLASSDDGRTIVTYPAMTLSLVALELHTQVGATPSSWSRLKTLYR